MVGKYRRSLVRSNLLYDDYKEYSFSNQSRLQMLILSRAVDDSGWVERTRIAAGLCNIENNKVKAMQVTLEEDDNSAIINIQLRAGPPSPSTLAHHKFNQP
jgi:hypothetical protein